MTTGHMHFFKFNWFLKTEIPVRNTFYPDLFLIVASVKFSLFALRHEALDQHWS